MPQAVVGGHAGAHQRSGVDILQIVGNQRQGVCRSNHVVGITAVETDAGDLLILAKHKVAPPAWSAVVAVSAMPAQPHALPGLKQRHIRTDGIHHAGNLMPRHTRIRDSRKQSELRNRIAVANAASLHAYAYVTRSRFREFFLH